MPARTSQESLEFQGMKIGRYEVIKRIAVGGMAEIFLAKDLQVRGVTRQVVLKCILPSISEDPSFVDLFLDEIRIAARLAHPNIAHVYDFGETEGRYFIAMEYIDGAHVSQLVRALHPRMVPVEHAVKIGALVAEALYYAHNLTDGDGRPLNVIHRDVSPENVMISRDGQVKLVDFGVARAADQVHETQVGVLRGKAAYLAPEQCMAKPLDRRVDVFALGTLLHEMLCGRRLFKRETDFQTMKAVCSAPIPPPSRVRPSVPEALDAIVLKALERDPDARYQQTDEMSFDLERVLQEERLLSNQILLGRFTRLVIEQSTTTDSPIVRFEAESSSSSASVSGVRPTEERKLAGLTGSESAARGPTAPPTERSLPSTKERGGEPSAADLSLGDDLIASLGDLEASGTSREWFDEESSGETKVDGLPREALRPRTGSIDIDVEADMLVAEALTGDESLFSDSSRSERPITVEIPGASKRRDLAAKAPRANADLLGVEPPPRAPEPLPPVSVDSEASARRDPSQPVRLIRPVNVVDDEGEETLTEPRPAAQPVTIQTPAVDLLDLNDPALQLPRIAPERHEPDETDDVETNVWAPPDGGAPVRPVGSRPSGAGAVKTPAESSGAWSAQPSGADLRAARSRRLWLWLAAGALAAVAVGGGLALTDVGAGGRVRASRTERGEPTGAQTAARAKASPVEPPAQAPARQEPPPRKAPGQGAVSSTPTPLPRGGEEGPAKGDGPPGRLVIAAGPNDRVFVDDKVLTSSDARRGVKVGRGEHVVRIVRARHRPWVNRVEVGSGAREVVRPRLKRAGARWGRLTVESDLEAELIVSGVRFGRTPVIDLVLWPGAQQVELVTSDDRRASRTVVIRRGRTSAIRVPANLFRAGPTGPEKHGERPSVAAARTRLENGDPEGCVQMLTGAERSPTVDSVLILCHAAADRLEKACAVARSARRCRFCNRYARSKCR